VLASCQAQDRRKSCSVHGATCSPRCAHDARMETTTSNRNDKARRNRRREVTIEILHTKHEVFTAAAEEIANCAKVGVTAEEVMAFLLEGESDAKDIANMYCWRVLHWTREGIAQLGD